MLNFDSAILHTVSVDTAALVGQLDALYSLRQDVHAQAKRVATAIIAKALPTCTHIDWRCELEYDDAGGTYPSVDTVTLKFSDRADVEFPAREDYREMAVDMTFEEERLQAIEHEHPELDEDERVDLAYAQTLGVTRDTIPALLQAVVHLVWDDPDAQSIVVRNLELANDETFVGDEHCAPCG